MVIDDDPAICKMLEVVLNAEGYDVTSAQSGERALGHFESSVFPVVILDLVLENEDGLELLQTLQAIKPDVHVIILTAHATVENAVKALRLGAADYLLKGQQVQDEIVHRVNKAFEALKLRRQNQRLEQELKRQQGYGGMVGASEAMQQLYQLIEQVADTDATVLVRGETGTGKELVTRAIHEKSARRDQPFVAVDCNIPETVAEPELFGVTENYPGFHRKEAMAGLFELADHGTLFFDEIGDLSLSIQAKILRTIQTREVRALGAERAIPIDVRIIGATNRDLEEAIANQQFREDLFYRFNVITIESPPLRERRDDIPLLAMHFFEKACTQFNKTGLQLTDEALKAMMAYDFPGNVRELQNIIERTVLVARSEVISPNEIMINQRRTPNQDGGHAGRDWAGMTLSDARDEMEKLYIERLLSQTKGNISEAARQAGIDRKNFRQKLSKHEVDAEAFRN